MTLSLLTFVILFSLSAYSEYRVYTLKITNSRQQTSRTIKSTLDPEQYKMFYPLQKEEAISYVKTWRCLGTTQDFAALCEAPLKTPDTPKNTSQNVQNKS